MGQACQSKQPISPRCTTVTKMAEVETQQPLDRIVYIERIDFKEDTKEFDDIDAEMRLLLPQNVITYAPSMVDSGIEGHFEKQSLRTTNPNNQVDFQLNRETHSLMEGHKTDGFGSRKSNTPSQSPERLKGVLKTRSISNNGSSKELNSCGENRKQVRFQSEDVATIRERLLAKIFRRVY